MRRRCASIHCLELDRVLRPLPATMCARSRTGSAFIFRRMAKPFRPGSNWCVTDFKSVMANVTKAVVLAAGKGTRMGALTEDLPKPMLPVKGKPLLEHILDHLGQAGVRECGLILGYRH